MDSNKRGLANTEKRSAVFVVSILVALMIDQEKSLRSLGVKYSMVTSSSGGLTNEYCAHDEKITSRSVLYVIGCYYVTKRV